MRFSQKRRTMPVINIISLIDILCILLIFFIVTTVFKRPEPMVPINVPKSSEAKAVGENEVPPLILYVTKEGKMFLGDQPVEPSRLAGELRNRKASAPDFKIAMKADAAVPFRVIVGINDAASQAGIGHLPTFMDEKQGTGTR